MTDSARRKEYIFEVLSGNSSDLLPLEQGSAIIRLVSEDPQELQKSNFLFGLILPLGLIFGMAALLVSFYQDLRSPILQLGEVCLLIVLFLWLWIQSGRREHRLRDFSTKIGEALETVDRIHARLDSYLSQLDARTSRYFHCVTNTKVTTYFVLMQMNGALVERLGSVRECLAGGKAGIVSAYNLLREPLVFRDGAIATVGNIHSVPLSRVSQTAELLMRHLDEGIKELEDEIKNWNNDQNR